MNLNDYQIKSKRTMPESSTEAVANYAMGLAGESGEVVDLLKKALFHGHSVKRSELVKELGDCLHYISGLATLYGIELEHIALVNIEKLQKRYPNGFSQQDSRNRVE